MGKHIKALAAAILLAFIPAFGSYAVGVRVATFNVEFGVGAPGSEEYDAVRAVLARIDADLVAVQEITTAGIGDLVQLATDLGYPHVVVGDLGPFAGGLRNAMLSRYPFGVTASIDSPPDARELTRMPLYTEIIVTGAAEPMHVVSVHFKSGSTHDDEFRRAIEAFRMVEDLDARGLDGSDALVIAGDCNDDVDDYQTASFAAVPAGLPQTYTLGSDIVFPVEYAVFPSDAVAELDTTPIDARQQDAVSTWTRIGSERRLDYIATADSLAARGIAAEIYDSALEYHYAGLPKAGDPPAATASETASDHLAVFADFLLPDLASPEPRLVDMGFEDGGLALWFVEPSGLPVTFQLQARPTMGSSPWVNIVASLVGPDSDGRYRFLTSIPAAEFRVYRIRATVP